MPTDYSKTRIYKIVSDQTEDVYVGSTIQPLYARIHGHKKDMIKGHYCSSHEIMKHGDYRIVLIENYPCDSNEQKLGREYYWIKEYRRQCINIVNKQCPGRNIKQWYEDNRDEILAKAKEYRENNRDEISAKSKEYRESNRDEISERKKDYYKNSRDKLALKQKKQYESNRDQILAKQKAYGEANKDAILEKRKSATFTCGCGSTCRQCDKARHERTIIHMKWAKNIISTIVNEDPNN